MTESVIGVDAVITHVGHNAVNLLRQGLGRKYWPLRMPCSVALTVVFGMMATNIHWKGDGSGDEGESEPAEGRLKETWQGSGKEDAPGGSSKRPSARR